MAKQAAVYILASKRNGTLYIGVTSDLTKGIWEHKNDSVEGFTKEYGVHRLVYYGVARRHSSGDHTRKATKKMEIGRGSWN